MIPFKPIPGQPADKTSRTYNETVDGIEKLNEEQDSQPLAVSSPSTTNKGDLVYAVNHTGEGIPWYGAVKLLWKYDSIGQDENVVPSTDSGDYAPRSFRDSLDEENFKQRVFLEAKLTERDVDEDDKGNSSYEYGEIVGIAQLPIQGSGNDVGRFLVQGVTQCKLHIKDEEHDRMEYAELANADDGGNVFHPTPCARGPFEILWKEPTDWEEVSSNSIVWALVRIDSRPRPSGITIVPESDGDNQFTAGVTDDEPDFITMTFPRTQAKLGNKIDSVEIPVGDVGAGAITLKNISGRPLTGWVGWNVSVERRSDGSNADPETEVNVELFLATDGETDDESIWGSEGWVSSSRRKLQTPTNSAAGFMLVTMPTNTFIKIRLTGFDMDSAPGTNQDDLMAVKYKGCHLSFYDAGNSFNPEADLGEGLQDWLDAHEP